MRADERPSPPRRRERRQRPTTPLERGLIVAAAAAAAVGGAVAGCEPTGTPVVDPVLTAAFAATVTLAASRARRWSWIYIAGLAAVASDTTATAVLAAAALVLAVAGSLLPRRRLWGAAVAALAVQSLLRLPDMGFHAASALYTVAATLPVLVSGYTLSPARTRRVVRRAGIVVGVAVGIGLVLFGISAVLAWNGVDRGLDQARAGLVAAGDGDQDTAARLFEDSSNSLRSSAATLDAWWARPARAVPLVAQQSEALAIATAEAANITDAAGAVAVSADLDDIRYTDGQIDVVRLAATREPLDQAVAVMDTAAGRLDAALSPWLFGPVRSRVQGLSDDVADTYDEVTLAADASAVAPSLLGADGPRRYLVLFTQPAELRGLGGFIGAYAELEAVDGSVELTRSGPIRELLREGGDEGRTISGPQEYLDRYGRFQPERFLQDMTFSPDMPSVAQVAAELYPQAGGQPVDGVIVVDPEGLAALTQITGPISVPELDQKLSAGTLADFLIRDQYIQFPDTEDRRDFLEDAGRETFDRLVGGSVPGPRKVGDVLGPAVEGRHLMVYAFDPAAQAFFDRLGVGGTAAMPARSDAFMVVTQNKGNNKIDSFLERSVDYRVEYQPDSGALEATAVVTLTNNAPASGLPLAVIGSNDQGLPLGTNAMYFSFYTPHRLTSASIDGEKQGMEFQRELGWAVYSRFLEIPAGASVQLVLELAGVVESGDHYTLFIGYQPTVNPDNVVATLQPRRPWVVDDATGFGVFSAGVSASADIQVTHPTVLEAWLVSEN